MYRSMFDIEIDREANAKAGAALAIATQIFMEFGGNPSDERISEVEEFCPGAAVLLRKYKAIGEMK